MSRRTPILAMLMATLTLTATAYGDLDTNLAGLWTFENAANLADDTSPWDNDGTVVIDNEYDSDISQGIGLIGDGAAEFYCTSAGFTNHYIEIPNASHLNGDSETVSYWINTTQNEDYVDHIRHSGHFSHKTTGGYDVPGGWAPIVFNDSGGFGQSFQLQSNGGNNLGEQEWDGAGDPVGYIDGQWHHIVSVYDAGTNTLKTWIDRELVVDQVQAHIPSGGLGQSTKSLKFGGQPDGEFGGVFVGRLDQIRIYNVAKSYEVNGDGTLIGGDLYEMWLEQPGPDLVITEDTTLSPGTYDFPNGVLIAADGVTFDMNGATLVGTGYENAGITCIGHDNVTIKNGTVHNYYYAIRVEESDNIEILNNDLSDNWVDPDSLEAPAPWLAINVGPNYGDRTNLGGGIYMVDCVAPRIEGNTLQNQENGIDAWYVTDATITGNDASYNTGWGIHLYDCDYNVVSNNVADHCIRPGLGDSAGCLVVYDSCHNQFLYNSFQYGGDGFFIGNEWGCPSNDNLIQGNDGSYAGANAFEATFSSGNQFIDNIADNSRHGFWLGYSHTGNLIQGNSIRGNNTNGIEIEHGQHNDIIGNDIIGNGGPGIVLRTDGQAHFPPETFPCLNLPNQEDSSHYTIADNIIHSNFGVCMELTQTTDSTIVNNLFGGLYAGTVVSDGARNVWAVTPTPGENIVGGPYLGGNWWSDYAGEDTDGDGIGDTDVPYTNGGNMALPGDPYPLIGDPPLDELTNPRVLCDRAWIDLGRNTRQSGATFDTANGAHYATDGTDLYLLEGANSTRLSWFDPSTDRYVPMAACPQSVWDGGDFQFGGGLFYATVGVHFDSGSGGSKGSYLYAYDELTDSWTTRARTWIDGYYYANEALAYDSVNHQLLATVVFVQNGGDTTATRRLARYNIATDTWVGFTSECPDQIATGSEMEYLDGKIFVWRGGTGGGAVNGEDSYLNVYDIATDTWSETPTLQDSGVVPGFRSGAFDIWGVALSADHARNELYLIGGESNHHLYVFDLTTQAWAVGPAPPYDGGWGDAMEYVAAEGALYQIDGRNSEGGPQGTAVMVMAAGDANLDGVVDATDFAALCDCMSGPEEPTPDGCHLLDLDCDNDVDLKDAADFALLFGE